MTKQQLITDYYIAHRDGLLAFVGSRLGDVCEAEDIVQNVFLRLLTTDRMITPVTLPALVYTVARNLMTDYRRLHTVFEKYEHYIKGGNGAEATAESVYSVREITERLECGLARLPENCREVYRMHVYGGMKVGEISCQLGQSYKSVENRLGIARKAMRQYLRHYA